MNRQIPHTNRKKNKLPFIILLLLLFMILLGVIIMAGKSSENNIETEEHPVDTETEALEKWQEGIISYNGKEYIYNQDIKAYLIMGIDKEGKVAAAEDYQSGGQSDAMFLLITNADNKTMSVVSINRNTMTKIETYYKNGLSSGAKDAQICTQHGFGDGRQLSCTRTVDAVSYLFYNLPIHGYLSLRLDAIPILNDAIGGVELKVLEDVSYANRDVDLKKGEVVTLTGIEAYYYLRGRELDTFDSSTNRLRRQEQYITSFVEQAMQATSGSTSKMLDMYEQVEDYIVTNLDFASLASELSEYAYDESRMYTIPGETVQGETFEEYHIEEDAFYDMIIELFYEEISR